jgi:RIO kinase 1
MKILKDATGNNHAPRMLVRDVDNLRRFFGQFAPELIATDYGKEIWALYESGALHSEVELMGRFEHVETTVDLDSVMREIDAARLEVAGRRLRLQERE